MNSYDTHTRKPNKVHLTETDFPKALKTAQNIKSNQVLIIEARQIRNYNVSLKMTIDIKQTF